MNDCLVVPLTRGQFALISPEDGPAIFRHRWQVCTHGYACRGRSKADGPGPVTIYLHRVLARVAGGQEVDHINRIKTDNRRRNLRVVTSTQNKMNSRGRGTASGYKGVFLHKRNGMYHAACGYQGKRVYLGYFRDPVAAARAYDAAARRFYGEHATLNFPEEGGDAS